MADFSFLPSEFAAFHDMHN